MKKALSVSFILLSILICRYGFSQSSVTYIYSGSIQTWTVPAYVNFITIEALGAEGGDNNSLLGGFIDGTPGKGAKAQGDFSCVAGQILSILVGGKGANAGYNGGGGGGSFVWNNSGNNLLIAAGGGGGAVISNIYNADGIDGSATSNGTNGNGMSSGGGNGGNGGTIPSGYVSYASGGAGWHNNGSNGTIYDCGNNSSGGIKPLLGGNGGIGGGITGISSAAGGFGGGGGGNGRCFVS